MNLTNEHIKALQDGSLIHIGPVDNKTDAYLIAGTTIASTEPVQSEHLPYSWIDFKSGAVLTANFTNADGIFHLVIHKPRGNTADSNGSPNG